MIFNIFRIFPTKSNRVSFITTKNASFESNLRFLAEELETRETSKGEKYEYHFIPKDRFSLSNMKLLATSKYIFLTDNFFALAFMRFGKKTKLIQLWHGTGLFKKFGYDLLKDNEKKVMLKFSNKITNLFVSSKNVVDIYARNFAIDKSKVIPLGIPRNDFYSKEHLDKEFVSNLKAEFEKIYPNIKGKKIVLKTFSGDCANKWKELGEKEKKKYLAKFEEDKLRYKKDLETVRHHLFMDYNDVVRRPPTAYRLFLNERLREGFEKNADPKEVQKQASEDRRKMS